MNNVFTKGSLITSFLVLTIFLFSVFPVEAAEESITAKSTSYGGTTIIEFKNQEDGNSKIESIRMWLSEDINFKSFKTEKGWIGKKSLLNVITFSTSEFVKPGESVKFGIKTDKQNAPINWKAVDENGNDLVTAKT